MTAPRWLLFSRHLVGLAIALAVTNPSLYTGVSASGAVALDWLFKLGFVVGLGLVINGLWALFFTSQSAGHFSRDLARLCWALGIVLVMGEWSPAFHRPSAEARELAPTSATSLSEAPKKARKIDELRAARPRLAGLSDAEVLQLVAADYPDIPIERIALDLGLRISKADQ